MSTENRTDAADPAIIEEELRSDNQAAEQAKRAGFGQGGDQLDTQMGNQGGAGASASGPDISHQSKPASINSSDLADK